MWLRSGRGWERKCLNVRAGQNRTLQVIVWMIATDTKKMASQNYWRHFFFQDLPEACHTMRDGSIHSVIRPGQLTITSNITVFFNVCYVEARDAIQMLVQRGDPNHLTFQHVALSLLLVFFLRVWFKLCTFSFPQVVYRLLIKYC